MANDMAGVIEPRSDQINADDLIAGPLTITISGVSIKGGQEQPVSIEIQGQKKVFRPCKSMSRVLVAAWGADAKEYLGRSLTLYRDPGVKWGGMAVGGIRISHMSDLANTMTMALTETKGSRKPFVVKPMAGGAAGDGPKASANEAGEGAPPKPPTLKERTEAAVSRASDLSGLDDVEKFEKRVAGLRADLERSSPDDLLVDLDEAISAAKKRAWAAVDKAVGE